LRASTCRCGQHFVDAEQEQAAHQEPAYRRNPGRSAAFLGQFHGGGQQGKEAGRNHHPGGKAEHEVHQPLINGFEEKDEGGAQCRHEPGKEGSQQRLPDRV
jgi:hypothetical protein